MRLNPDQIEAIKQETKNLLSIGARVVDIQRGFTLVELIMTMVIIGILAAVVAPRFFDNNVFQSRGFADQVQATLRYAQKIAIAQRRNVCVTFSLPAPSTVTLRTASLAGAGSLCDTDFISPTGDPTYVITAPDGISFTALPAAFSFNGLGSPSLGQSIFVNGAANPIVVEVVTGYVHSP